MPVSNVFGPEVPGGPSGGATGGVVQRKSLTIDISGSAGALTELQTIPVTLRDAGGAAIGSINMTASGVGAGKTNVQLVFTLSDILRELEPNNDVIGITFGTSAAITWGREATGPWINRSTLAFTPGHQLFDFRNAGSTNRLWGAQATGAAAVYDGGLPTYDPRSFGLICTPATTDSVRSTTDYGTAMFTPADLADGVRTATEVPNGTAENDFTASPNLLLVGLNSFVGTDTGAITQSASGISVELVSFILPIERIHVFVMGGY
jgi:hypothetical protein